MALSGKSLLTVSNPNLLVVPDAKNQLKKSASVSSLSSSSAFFPKVPDSASVPNTPRHAIKITVTPATPTSTPDETPSVSPKAKK